MLGCSLQRLLIRLLVCYSYHINNCLKHTRLRDFSWPVHSLNGLYLRHIQTIWDVLLLLTFWSAYLFQVSISLDTYYFIISFSFEQFFISIIWIIFLDHLVVHEEKTLPLESQYIDKESGEEYKLIDKPMDIVSSKWLLGVCLNTI